MSEDKRAFDGTLHYLALCLLDDAIEGLSMDDPDVFFRVDPETIKNQFGGHMPLKIRPEAKEKRIMRGIKRDPDTGEWVPDPVVGLSYAESLTTLKRVGRACKYIGRVYWYMFRNMDVDLVSAADYSDADKRALYGHNKSSKVADNVYQSKLTTVDVQSLVTNGTALKDAAAPVRGMQWVEDFPFKLSFHGERAVEFDPDLVACLARVKELETSRPQFKSEAALAEACDDGDEEALELREARLEVRRTRKRLTKAQLALEQSEHLDRLVNSALESAGYASATAPTSASTATQPGLSSSTSSNSTGADPALTTPGPVLSHTPRSVHDPFSFSDVSPSLGDGPSAESSYKNWMGLDFGEPSWLNPALSSTALNSSALNSTALNSTGDYDSFLGDTLGYHGAPRTDTTFGNLSWPNFGDTSLIDPALLDGHGSSGLADTSFESSVDIADSLGLGDSSLDDISARDLELYLDDLTSPGGAESSQLQTASQANPDDGEDGQEDPVGAWSPPTPSALATSLRSALSSLPDPYPPSESEVSQLRRELFEKPTLSRGQLAVLMTKAANPTLKGRYPGEEPVNGGCPVPGCPKVWTGAKHAGQQARHIHKCYQDLLIDTILDTWANLPELDLSRCPMKTCTKTNFASASDLSVHVAVNHRRVTVCQVMMPDGSICGHEPSYLYNDMAEHRELAHGIIEKRAQTARPMIVGYCASCKVWLKGQYDMALHAQQHLPEQLEQLTTDPGCLASDSDAEFKCLCPFCLTNEALNPLQRASTYSSSASMRDHVA